MAAWRIPPVGIPVESAKPLRLRSPITSLRYHHGVTLERITRFVCDESASRMIVKKTLTLGNGRKGAQSESQRDLCLVL
ncbi:hypothetical protein N0V90_009388 [Kalmusia sp. IMI 367209]|nr:hypothetical protein N0V90_009388 [Kalmusia sp. IMI 367209]